MDRLLSVMAVINTSFSPEKRIGDVDNAILDNGLRLFVHEKHDAPTVTVQAWVKTGSINEGEHLGCGLSHFLEHMMFQGTELFPGHALTETVNRCGGDINAYTSYGSTVYYLDLPAEFSKTGIDMLADVLQHPLFPEEKFFDEKNVILRERDMNQDNPGRMLIERLWLDIFRVHPVRHPIIGYLEKIQSVDRDMMASYYQDRYSPARTFLLICGDVRFEKVLDWVEKRFGDWGMGPLTEPALPSEPKQVCSRSSISTFNDPLARMAIGYKIPDASHPDVPALDILAALLGQTRSSRLQQRLKRDKQLAISVNAFNYTPYFCGVTGMSAVCTPEKVPELQEELLAEVRKIQEGDVNHEELERAVVQQATDYIRGLRSNASIARIIGNSFLTYGATHYADTYLENISALKPADISRVASKYLDENMSTTIQMIPEEEIKRKRGKRSRKRAPEPSLSRCEDGQRVIALRNSDLPLVDFCVVLPGGSFFETWDNAGITRLLCSCLMTGTESFSEKELAEILDANAIELSVSSGNNTIILRANCHRDKLDTAMGIVESLLCEPKLSETEFAREQLNTIDALKSRQLNPQCAAEDRLLQLMFRKHPYSHPSSGTPESISSLTTDQLRTFLDRVCLNPEKAVFGLSGDITVAQSRRRLEHLVGCVEWQASKAHRISPPSFLKRSHSEHVGVPREQAFVLVAVPGCYNGHPDSYALDILQQSMCGQSSRLFESIREEAGLAYYTGMYSSRGLHPGFLAFYAGTHPDSAVQVVDMINEERIRLAEKGLRKSEFADAKAGLIFSICEQKQHPGNMIFNSALAEYYNLGHCLPWQRDDIYQKLTLGRTNQIIRKHLATSQVFSITASP